LLKIPTSSVNFDDAEAGKGAFDRIRKKTITQTNNEMKKAHTKTQKQQNEIGTNKRKVQKMKNQVKSTKNMAKKI